MPEWKADSEFITVFLDQAFNLDAKPSSHPIEVDCPTAGDIVQVYTSLELYLTELTMYTSIDIRPIILFQSSIRYVIEFHVSDFSDLPLVHSFTDAVELRRRTSFLGRRLALFEATLVWKQR